METIFEFQGKYRFLSNFWPTSVELDGESYPTVEHAYQAAKTLNPMERKVIRALGLPGEAKRAGRHVTMRPDWEEVKVGIMKELCRQKFLREPMHTWLLGTGGAEIIEGNQWGDTFWGVCHGVGENHLGRILMELREEYREE